MQSSLSRFGHTIPVEIWVEIVRLLPTAQDRARLASTSKQFRDVVLPVLYGDVSLQCDGNVHVLGECRTYTDRRAITVRPNRLQQFIDALFPRPVSTPLTLRRLHLHHIEYVCLSSQFE